MALGMVLSCYVSRNEQGWGRWFVVFRVGLSVRIVANGQRDGGQLAALSLETLVCDDMCHARRKAGD